MRRPLIAVALFYVAGILLAALPIPLAELFALAAVLALVFLLSPVSRRVTLASLIILCGWINFGLRQNIVSPNDLRNLIAKDEIATVRGVLLETPQHRAHYFKNQKLWSSHARMDVSAIHRNEHDWQPAHGQIISSLTDYLPTNFFAGQTVEITGVIRLPPGPIAEGLFDYRNFLGDQGIHYQLASRQISNWQLISSPAHAPLSDQFSAWARKTLALGLPVEDETLQLEWALTLGWKEALTDDLSDPFMKAATYHIFAVDGLRIAILAAILLALGRTLRLSRAWCGVAILPFLCFYAAMTGWPPSAVRAIVMAAVIFGGWVLRRPSDFLNSLFVAALIILVCDPGQLYQAGFQLSFFVVLCIILILPFFDHLGKRVLQPDSLLPESLRPRWQKILHIPIRWTVDLFATSLAAWLGSIPLVAWYFHLLTPLSGFSNMFAVPLCILVLLCNLASLLFATWLPGFSILYNHAGWFCMACIQSTSKWSAHWPGAYYYVSTPDLFTVALYYLILLTTLTGWLFREKWRAAKISAVLALVFVWCGLWLWNCPVSQLTVVPLKGGHAIYVNSNPNHQEWLIDCGDEDAANDLLKPFLEAHGVNHLANFILTHGEIHYTGGANVIDESFHPKNIYFSSIHFRSTDYRDFQMETKNHSSSQLPLKAGDHFGPWTVLYPPEKTSLRKSADNALVLRGDFDGLKVLLLSDLSHAGQNALLTSSSNLQADLLISGLPEDGQALCVPLLNAVRPQVVVVAGTIASLQDSDLEALRHRLTSRHIPVFYTSDSEAVTLTTRPGRWRLCAMDGSAVEGTIRR